MRAFKIGLMSLTLLAAGQANAATLVLNNGWSTIAFGAAGSSIVDQSTGDTSYTFSLAGPGYLNITDAFLIGDRFQLTVNGNPLAQTSVPGTGPSLSNADAAFNSGYYSRGSYLLGVGNYNVTGIVTTSPFNSGGAYIQLSSNGLVAVPEPATWAMLIGGVGLAGGALRRQRTLRRAYA